MCDTAKGINLLGRQSNRQEELQTERTNLGFEISQVPLCEGARKTYILYLHRSRYGCHWALYVHLSFIIYPLLCNPQIISPFALQAPDRMTPMAGIILLLLRRRSQRKGPVFAFSQKQTNQQMLRKIEWSRSSLPTLPRRQQKRCRLVFFFPKSRLFTALPVPLIFLKKFYAHWFADNQTGRKRRIRKREKKKSVTAMFRHDLTQN